MTNYKKTIIEITNMLSEMYFSVPRDAEEEKHANEIFSKFKYKIKEDADINIMFMLLKVILIEGVMLNGTRSTDNPNTDA
jgi:hypothetical protein